jgi:hypothetical protein
MTNLHRSLQIFFWSYAFLYVVLCSLQITQVDLWYQLAEGSKILDTWTLPTAPPAAYGLPASPYFDEYVGYEIILVLLFKLGGFFGLWVVFASIYLAIMFLPLVSSGKSYPAFDFSTTFAMFFAGILMRQRLEQRPELVGTLFLVLLMVLLHRAELEKITTGMLAALFFLFVAWTNTHSSFVIGFFTLGLWGACELALKCRTVSAALLLRNAAAIGAVVLVASCLNPYGPRRLLFPFLQAADPGSTALSPEMWPITDMTNVAGILASISIVLLLWGALTTRKVPLWLILFSVFAIYLSLKSFRFVNILAIAMLFVYAARTGPKRVVRSVLPIRVLKDVALCLLCVFLLFLNAFSFSSAYHEMRATKLPATHTARFAPDICAVQVEDAGVRVPVLCGHGVGSYLSFGDSQFRPLLDSGLSHFSDDTKRYFFFLWRDPQALELALQHLHVNYLLLTDDTFAWLPTLHRLPDWQFVTCDSSGMILRRSTTPALPLTADQRELIARSSEAMAARNEITGAFGYSTLLDEPARSLDILERYPGSDWTESLFNHFSAWVDLLPAPVVEKYLASEHRHSFPTIDAILSARLGPERFEQYAATNPPGPRPWTWEAVEVECALKKGDRAKAKQLFDSIQPAPMSSTTYYRLRQAVDGASPAGAYGRWQTWDDEGQQLMITMSSRLNDRMVELDGNEDR